MFRSSRTPRPAPPHALLTAVSAAALLAAACGETPAGPGACDPSPADVICVAGNALTVEIADDREERTTGLMGRDSLPEDGGMLFVFPEPDTVGFFMKDTTIPLDLAYLDADGVIFQIEAMEPLSEEVVRSDGLALYALEVNRGWFADHGAGVGDTARLGF